MDISKIRFKLVDAYYSMKARLNNHYNLSAFNGSFFLSKISTPIKSEFTQSYDKIKDKFRKNHENISFHINHIKNTPLFSRLLQGLKFKLNNYYQKINDNFNFNYNNIALNIKHSSFFSRIFSKLNNKTIFVLFLTYFLFISVQLLIFSSLWKAPDISNIDEVKNYLSSYIFKYESISEKIESKLNNYRIEVESFAKEISVPFHLNWIADLQKRLNKRIKKRPDIAGYFIFNHLGRLLNSVPDGERYRNINYMFTPYLKKVFQSIPRSRESVIYFYTDNELILEKYKLGKGIQIKRGKHYMCDPFYFKKLLIESDKKLDMRPEDINTLFRKKEYTFSHVPYLMFFSPVFNQLDKFIGVAGFNIDIDTLFKEVLLENNKLFHTTVMNDKGIIVYSLNRSLIGKYLFYDKNIRDLLRDPAELVIKDKTAYLKHRIKNTDWYIISRINPEKPFFINKNPLYNPLLAAFFGLEAFVFIIIFLFFKKNVSRPLAVFSVGLKNLIKGNGLSEIKLDHDDEFRLIENRFNALADKVRGYLIFGKTISKELVDEYLGKDVTGQIQTEEKVGTVMYLKIKNCDQIRKSMSKEGFDILMNKLFNDVEIFVSKYKGFIESFSSDSIIALFGIPLNGYNHSQYAYDCAEKMFENIKIFNRVNKVSIKISISINTGDIFYSQMLSNYGKLFVSLGETIRNACHYESITGPYILALSESAMEKLSVKPPIKKTIRVKLKDMPAETTLYLKNT